MKYSEHELMRELYSKMKYQLLRSKCIVAYNRECYVYPPGNVRVTLDMDICGNMNITNKSGYVAVSASKIGDRT